MSAELAAEVRALFGEPVAYLAAILDPAEINLTAELMDRVHDAAYALLRLAEDPEGQQKYVQGLPFDVRVLLCMWLVDTGTAAKLTRAAAKVCG